MSPESMNRLLTRKELAAYLGVSVQTVDRHVAPYVPVVRLGRLKMFRIRDIECWLARQRRKRSAA